MKTVIFMICLLAFSSAGRDSDQVSFKGDVLTSEVRHSNGQAVLVPANGLPAVEALHLAESKNHSSFKYKFESDSRLIHSRLITQVKIRENIIPLLRNYLKDIPYNKNDLPDLS
jgi:hypothetical protein